jgi:hypothetical protein
VLGVGVKSFRGLEACNLVTAGIISEEDSLFRADYGLLWAFTFLKHPQRYPLSTVCEDVLTFCMK